MGWMRWLVALSLCLGCEDEPDPPPTESASVESEPAAEVEDPTPGPVEEPAAPLRADIGWAELPELPSAEARATNRRALRLHRRGSFEDSLEGFRAAVALSAGYTNARFNAACALAKLERFEDAATELEALFALDLPTYGPRYGQDDDLSALREGPHGARLQSVLETLERSYRATMRSGPAVVFHRSESFDDDDGDDSPMGRVYAQAGVWWSSEHRFVPMGPAVSLEYPYLTSPILRTWFDVRHARVYAGSALDYQGDMGIIGDLHFRVFSVPDGAELGSARPRTNVEEDEEYTTSFSIRSDERGVRWEAGPRRGYLVEETYPEDDTPPAPPVGATFDQESARLTIGEGDDAKVVRMRRHRSGSTRVVRHGSDALLVLTGEETYTLDGLMAGDWVLSRVERSSGEVTRLDSGVEQIASLTVAPDGSVYLDAGGVLRTVPESGDPVELPRHLRLRSP